MNEFFKGLTDIKHLDSDNFFLIAGPCCIEDSKTAHDIAQQCIELSEKYQLPYLFKASYRKANRSSVDSFTGIGDEAALEILAEVKARYNVPVVTDVHSVSEVESVAEVADVLQIPAFLCRQTDLIVAAAKTNKIVNIKKGQFMSAEVMNHAVLKVKSTGNDKVMLTERGTSFGYQDLIVDYRGIPTMQSFKVPVVVDVTHSLQQPNQSIGITGGKPEMIETVARAAIAVGADGIFIETHPNPAIAKSDGANMLALDKLDALLTKLVKIRKTINSL